MNSAAEPGGGRAIPVYLNLGVTAHRDIVPGEIPGIERRVREFLLQLRQRWPGLELQLMSPLAEGGDRLAARVALELGLPLIAVLPMAQAEYEADFGSAASLEEFRELLRGARQVIELPRCRGTTGAAEPAAFARARQYAQAGVFISSHSQILLALWDGRPGDALGGTAHVVRYHLSGVMAGFEDAEAAAELLGDNENDLAYHIVCSRSRPEGAPEAGLAALDCHWLTSLHGRTPAAELPAEYALMFTRLEGFARDPAREASGVGVVKPDDGGLPRPGPTGLPLPDSARYAADLFRVADRLALHYQRRVTRGLYAIHALAVLMGLVFIVYSEYPAPRYLLWAFLALFFAGLAVHLTGRRREWHRKYLDYRGLAEGLRVQFFWNLAGVPDPASPGFVFQNFLQKQDVELGWIRHVMRSASLLRRRGVTPDPAWLPWVIEHWVGRAGSEHGQLAYYARKESVNAAKLRKTERLGAACLWAGIGFAFVLAVAGEWLGAGLQQLLLVLMGILPLLAGVRDAVSHKQAEKELIRQFRFMARLFANARRLLDETREPAFQRRVLRALGEAALDEGAEWILTRRTRPLEAQGLG